MNDWFEELQQQMQQQVRQAIDQAATEFDQQWDTAIDQAQQWVEQLAESLDALDAAASDLAMQTESRLPTEMRHALREADIWLVDCLDTHDRAVDGTLEQITDALRDWTEWLDRELLVDDDADETPRPDQPTSTPTPTSTPSSDRYTPTHREPPSPEDDPDWFVPLSHVRPSAKRHRACRGCQHYHGYQYGDHLLVCAMHPYGYEGDHCPDWEGDRDAETEKRG